MRGYLTRGKPLGVQGRRDLVHIVQPPLPFLTMTGSNEPSRSRGASMVTGPAPSVVTVLTVVPLRVFALRPRVLFSCFARPGCSVVSSSKAVSGTVPVNCPSGPSGPVGSSPPLLRPPYHLQRELPLGGTRTPIFSLGVPRTIPSYSGLQ